MIYHVVVVSAISLCATSEYMSDRSIESSYSLSDLIDAPSDESADRIIRRTIDESGSGSGSGDGSGDTPAPSDQPTSAPTFAPTFVPTFAPTSAPTSRASTLPQPLVPPTLAPVSGPTTASPTLPPEEVNGMALELTHSQSLDSMSDAERASLRWNALNRLIDRMNTLRDSSERNLTTDDVISAILSNTPSRRRQFTQYLNVKFSKATVSDALLTSTTSSIPSDPIEVTYTRDDSTTAVVDIASATAVVGTASPTAAPTVGADSSDSEDEGVIAAIVVVVLVVVIAGVVVIFHMRSKQMSADITKPSDSLKPTDNVSVKPLRSTSPYHVSAAGGMTTTNSAVQNSTSSDNINFIVDTTSYKHVTNLDDHHAAGNDRVKENTQTVDYVPHKLQQVSVV